MNVKKGLLVLAIIVLAGYIFQPTKGEASSQLDKINQQLAQVRKEMSAATHNRNQADKDKEYILQMKDKTAKSVNEIVAQINEVGGQLNDVQSQIDDKEAQVKQTGADLEAAEARLATQDKLLKSRVRLMYTNGVVSYLDVLLSATSFSDFIDRMDSLSSILGQGPRHSRQPQAGQGADGSEEARGREIAGRSEDDVRQARGLP